MGAEHLSSTFLPLKAWPHIREVEPSWRNNALTTYCTPILLNPLQAKTNPLITFFIYIDESEDGSIENLIRKLYIPLIYQLKGAIVNLFSKEERSLPFMLKSSFGKPQCIALTLQIQK